MSNKNYLSVYAKSFNWAGFFLPKKTYKKCSALYDFCRVVDNIADDKEKLEVKAIKFKQFKEDFVQKNFDNPIVKNMWHLIDEFKISIKIIEDLLDGISSDIKDKVILNSKKDLLIYSYRVAGTVGLMMAKILKVNKKSSLKSAIDLGIAMQLTNISRDVIEDSKINRFYINKNSIRRIIEFQNIRIDLNKQIILQNNSEYKINNTEKIILEEMINNPGKIFAREEIGKLINLDKERSIDVIITRLRKKIEINPKNPKFLQTIRGSGYVLWIE